MRQGDCLVSDPLAYAWSTVQAIRRSLIPTLANGKSPLSVNPLRVLIDTRKNAAASANVATPSRGQVALDTIPRFRLIPIFSSLCRLFPSNLSVVLGSVNGNSQKIFAA